MKIASPKYTYECHQSGLQWCPRRCFVEQVGLSSQASFIILRECSRLSDNSFHWFVSVPHREPEREPRCLSLSSPLAVPECSNGVKVVSILWCQKKATNSHRTEISFLNLERAWMCSQASLSESGAVRFSCASLRPQQGSSITPKPQPLFSQSNSTHHGSCHLPVPCLCLSLSLPPPPSVSQTKA